MYGLWHTLPAAHSASVTHSHRPSVDMHWATNGLSIFLLHGVTCLW